MPRIIAELYLMGGRKREVTGGGSLRAEYSSWQLENYREIFFGWFKTRYIDDDKCVSPLPSELTPLHLPAPSRIAHEGQVVPRTHTCSLDEAGRQ